jgi:hypothetical protein
MRTYFKMGKDLNHCNLKFKEIMDKLKDKRMITKDIEMLCYYFFIAGFEEGEGMTQMAI